MRSPAFLIIGLASVFLIFPLLASAKPSKEAEEAKRQAKLYQKKLSKDQQIVHALDRLTFGPKPGDVAHVKKMGLKKWLDLQLHPERIPENRNLEAKLQPLESLRMTPMEAGQHYPTPQMIRDFGRRAENMGLDSIWMGEHVALFDKNTYGYPGSKDGRIPVPDGGGRRLDGPTNPR